MKMNSFEWHWEMRETASFPQWDTDTQSKGTEELKGEKLKYYQSQTWRNERQAVGREKPPNQTETTWRCSHWGSSSGSQRKNRTWDTGRTNRLSWCPICPSSLCVQREIKGFIIWSISTFACTVIFHCHSEFGIRSCQQHILLGDIISDTYINWDFWHERLHSIICTTACERYFLWNI